MKLTFWETVVFYFKRIFTLEYSIRAYPVNNTLDDMVKEILYLDLPIQKIYRHAGDNNRLYTVTINNKVFWVANYPYAYLHLDWTEHQPYVNECFFTSQPTMKTIVMFKKWLDKKLKDFENV